MDFSVFKEENSHLFSNEKEKKEKTWVFSIVKDPNSRSDLSFFESDPINLEFQSKMYESLLTLPQIPKILPKYYGKLGHGLLFQPLKCFAKTWVKGINFHDFMDLYKKFLNGLASLQTIDLSVQEFDVDSLYLTEFNELKFVFLDKMPQNNENCYFSKVVNFTIFVLAMVLGENICLIQLIKENDKIDLLMNKFSSIFLGGEISLEEKDHLKALVKIFRKILTLKKTDFDFMKLFLKSFAFKSKENLKKMIFIEEAHGLEIAYDILIKKGLMKFDLQNHENTVKIFGFSSVPLEKRFHKIEEIKIFLEEIKPITTMNINISCEISNEIAGMLNSVINKKTMRLENFKSLVIQLTPEKQLVGNSQWYKFLWHSFFKHGCKPIENSGISFLKEHSSQW